MWTTRATWIALAAAIVLLARGLPAETFFVGDPGVKLLAARAAIDRPSRPLEIPLPSVGDERVAYLEPFFVVHADHSHPITSELFPLLSAPFIAIFGMRGAYVLPALGFLLAIWACAHLAGAIDGRPPPATAVMLCVALGTPLLFYGLEFWEHAPAVGLAALATTVLLKSGSTDGTGGYTAVGAGLLYGLSMLLRPEAAWFFVAVVAASRLLPSPTRWSAIGAALVGIAVALTPLTIYSIAHFGTIAPPHLATQADLLTIGWLQTRAEIIPAWFFPIGFRMTPMWGMLLVLVGALGLAMPGMPGSPRKFLVVLATVDVALVVLTAPNDGGGQWGPRYLLFAYIPSSLLLADFMRNVSRRTVAGVVATVLVAATGVWVQRSGYRELRGTKIIYGRILDFVRHEVPAGGVAVTDLWWLDQVAASATSNRVILFAQSPATASEILARLDRAGHMSVTLFSDRGTSPAFDAGGQRSCYAEYRRAEIQDRALLAVQLQRKEPCAP